MNKPDADRFGRILLTDLASIKAEAVRTRIIVELVARHLKIPNVEKLIGLHELAAEEAARQSSAEALKDAGFDISGTGTDDTQKP